MPETDLFNEIASLDTERINHRTIDIDISTTEEILKMINYEDSLVAEAVKVEIISIANAVDAIVECFTNGGRLFYIGSGTSGRLGIIDAAECPPTFGTNPEQIQGIIAGGHKAVFVAQEGVEDFEEFGAKELDKYNINSTDILCGIAASGRTPYVRGALLEAKKRNITTILVTTSSKEKIKHFNIDVDYLICVNVGPEAIAGSTRMKSGTAQKLILNMLTTTAMIRMGKTLGNVMIDLQLNNHKLQERAKRILMLTTGISYDEAENYLKLSDNHVKTAIVMILCNVDKQQAKELIIKSNGFVKKAIEQSKKS